VIGRRALLVLALAPNVLTGCGGGDGSASGDLRWEKAPSVSTPETLPNDRIATGKVRNDSLRRVDLKASDIEVVDAEGRAVESAGILLAGFGRGLYNPVREPAQIADSELTRTGRIAKIEPGSSVPLTVSWRMRGAIKEPLRVEYGAGGGSLPLPR